MGHKNDREIVGAELPAKPAVTRRNFLQGSASIAGGGLLLKDTFFSNILRALPPAASIRTQHRIAATPTHAYRPYRSKRATTADIPTWVQIDLGTLHLVEAVALYPANQRMKMGADAYYAGEAFPLRFKVEASKDSSFTHPQLIADYTAADFENPKDTILNLPGANIRSRYVRLTVTKLAEPECRKEASDAPEANTPCSPTGDYYFALSKIAVLSAGKDVALGQPTTADETYGNPEDLQQVTRPVRVETEFVHHDRPENVTEASSWARVPYAAQAPLQGVTLHGGVFEATMRNNIRYLLDSFTLDDLLLQFRERAGKPIPPSTHKPDKFWEEDLAGSNAGRFLMGAGNTLRWIDDSELRTRFNGVMDGIAECRQPDGWVMAFPEDTIFYSERGAYTRAWLTHGLIEAGYAGDPRAFNLLRANYDRFNHGTYLPDLLRGAVQGGQGMIADTRMYFTPTGKPADIQVIQRYFLEDRWLESLATYNKDQIWQYPYDRPHCYLLTNLEAYLDLYRATGDKRWHDGVKAAWEMYNQHWEQPGGSISIIEYNYDPPDSNSLTKLLGELCGSSFWTFLSQRFQLMHPDDERYAAEIEKSIYNVAIANQQGSYGLRYHTILVGNKEEGTRKNTCCEGQGTRLIGSIPEHIYSVASDGLYLNLFEPSTIVWKHSGEDLTLRMDTKFPYDNHVKLTVATARPASMKLRVRVPSWAATEMKVEVNGEVTATGKPGSYLLLERTWSTGDTVAFTLPATTVLTEYTGVDQLSGHKRYSLTYGPLLLAAVGSKDAVLRLPSGNKPEDLVNHLVPHPDQPLHFNVADNPGVVYMPYWQIDKQEFTCFPVIDAKAATA
jgi:DUF1680 family protein